MGMVSRPVNNHPGCFTPTNPVSLFDGPEREYWTTYRQVGGYVAGEYAFVTDPEYFEDADPAVEVIVEKWQLVSREVVKMGVPTICLNCEGEGTLPLGTTGVECPICKGEGTTDFYRYRP